MNPSVLGICSGWARERILQHARKFLHFTLIVRIAGINVRSDFLSSMAQLLHAELYLAAHQRLVSVTAGAVVAVSELDAGKVNTSGED